MTKQSGFLDELVVGWFGIEPIILGCIAAKQHFILRSRHGASKTMFAKISAQATGGIYRHYDATKDDMVSVAGIPNPEALKQGVLAFSKHDRSIWDADFISIDELSRAPRESQNMWLEVLEERTCFGFPLKYRMAVATMNPETYSATYRVDEALLDRFTAVVEVPDVLGGAKNKQVKDTIRQIVQLNMAGENRNTRDSKKIQALGEALQTIEQHYNDFIVNETVLRALQDYVADFGYELNHNMRKETPIYVSPRRYILLANCIAACAAYYKHAQSVGLLTSKDGVFVDGAEIAVAYVFATALGLDPAVVLGCHEKAKNVLKNIAGSKADKLRYSIQHTPNPIAQVQLLQDNMNTIAAWTPVEITNVLQMVTSTLFVNVRQFWTQARTKNGITVKEAATIHASMLETACAIDNLKSWLITTSNKAPTILRVVSDNVLGNLTCNVISLMQDIAQDCLKKGDKKEYTIATYEQLTKANSATPLFRKLWSGNLINNSLKDTIKTVMTIK